MSHEKKKYTFSPTKKRKAEETSEEKNLKVKSDYDIIVAFQGIEGAYSEEAALSFFNTESGEKKIKTIGLPTFQDVFTQVESGLCDYGICPIENSESGVFRSVVDLLLKHKLFIVGECAAQDEHCLCAVEGVTKADIKRVYSHPDVIDQCQNYIRRLEKKSASSIRTVYNHDTAGACALLARLKRKDSAAIATHRAARLHNLVVLEQRIGDDAQTSTRYVVVATQPYQASPAEANQLKTSVCVSLRNEPGALLKCLSCFFFRNINILKLETRPASKGKDQFSVKQHWEYLFYLDYKPPSREVQEALTTNLKEFCLSIRDLGTYVANLPTVEFQQPDWQTHFH